MKISELSEKAKIKCKLCFIDQDVNSFYVNRNGIIDLRCKQCQSRKHAFKYKTITNNIDDTKSKICINCNTLKLLSKFPPHKTSEDGTANTCYKCKSLHEKLNVNPDKYWWRKSCILSRYKNGKVTGLELKTLFYKQEQKCYYCKVNLTESNIHIDHKIPVSRNGLTTIDNLVIACKDCNLLKLSRTSEEFIDFIHIYIKRFNMPTRTEDLEEIAKSGAERRSDERINSQESETSHRDE